MKCEAILTTSFVRFGLAALLVFTLPSAYAQTADTGTRAESPLRIQFLGSGDDMVLFNLDYKNPGGQRFSVLVTDQQGGLLYQEAFKDTDFSRRFRLPAADKSKFTFIIRSARQTDITKTFEISVNNRFVENFAVRKVN